MFLLLILLSLSISIYLVYKWSMKTYNAFDERGVPYQKPVPFFGNAWPLLTNNQNLHKLLFNLYKEGKRNKVFGFFNFRDPIFIVNDPELIKKITVKDFDAFTNHLRLPVLEKEPLFSGMITVMKDQRWKNMRNTLTPAFTGAKMRAMFVLMNECFDEAINFLQQKVEPTTGSCELEMKEFFCRLSNDLIATTAFGLKVNSYENEKNQFYTVGSSISKARGLMVFKMVLSSFLPNLFKLLNMRLLNANQTDYFVNLVCETMKYRQQHNIIRPDMIQLLMEAKNESEIKWSDEEIVSQCFIFFFAAFENNALLLCSTCYELANNLDIQEKLYEEIIELHAHLNGKTLDYDALKRMKYLDMVLQESLRKWTLTAMMDRECGKDYKVVDDEGNFLCDFKKGDKIWFNVIGIHWDEQYYEHAEIFDPERFNDVNKQNINPFTYLPFGIGPRSCIGNRYALMQAKAMLFYLLKAFKVERSDKLTKNLLDDSHSFTINPKNGYWFKLIKRSETASQ